MIPPIRRMVAGVASLTPDDAVLAAALPLSTGTGADLTLVHVDTTDPRPGTSVSLSRTGALRGVVESVMPGVTATGRVTCRALAGNAEQRLREAVADSGADLVVLGATRRGALARTLLGTTATHLLRRLHVPMLVVRGPLPRRPLRVLLTTDLSRHAAAAHARGLALAQALSNGEPELRSLFVQVPYLGDAPVLIPMPPMADAERTLAAFLDAEAPGMAIAPCVRTGDPAMTIVDEARAWNADLVILGTHGRRGANRMMLGSVAETVLRNAPCAALVIPPVAAPVTEPAREVAPVRALATA